MYVRNINILGRQRDALLAPAKEAVELHRQQVMGPLRPLWEPMMSYMPAKVPRSQCQEPEEESAALAASRLIGLYGPDSGTEEGLEALSKLGDGGSMGGCVQALEAAIEELRPREHGLDFEGVTFALALADPTPDLMERHKGYMGAGSFSDWILAIAWPTNYNLPRLPALATHELHHKVRLAFEPWNGETRPSGSTSSGRASPRCSRRRVLVKICWVNGLRRSPKTSSRRCGRSCMRFWRSPVSTRSAATFSGTGRLRGPATSLVVSQTL